LVFSPRKNLIPQPGFQGILNFRQVEKGTRLDVSHYSAAMVHQDTKINNRSWYFTAIDLFYDPPRVFAINIMCKK
jgi:hypothetical protein